MSSIFPIDPLDKSPVISDIDHRRRAIIGIIESYNGNYDVLAEGIQNAMDAVEDAAIAGVPGPYMIEVSINLVENWISILDTGIGMHEEQIGSAFAPNVSFKTGELLNKRNKATYRGYKGVGLTYLAYGTDDITIHSKHNNILTKGRMQYGRAWAEARRDASAMIVEDTGNSPLDDLIRGTYVRIRFSNFTRPKSLSHLATSLQTWETILRTRTAIGQLLLECEAITKVDVKLRVIGQEGTSSTVLEPEFMYPHKIKRTPPFRFLDLTDYYQNHQETSTPPRAMLRQDGIYLTWATDKIKRELGSGLSQQFEVELNTYTPCVYAFVPYAATVWADMNQLSTGTKNRTYHSPGLMIGVNRQRLADIFDINPSRFQFLGLNSLVIVHFENAKPDYGRKTVQEEVLELARQIANRVVQYLSDQRAFLRDPGEAPTEGQRETEKDHEDWLFNVKDHSVKSPIHQPPITYISTPLTEQDVVGLFNQLSALGIFPGIKIFSTSQIQTYDCLVKFECETNARGLSYVAEDQNPLGLSPRVLGTKRFETRSLTLEFKNNLDGLIADFGDSRSRKSFNHIDLCVCWSKISPAFKGYELEEVTGSNYEERRFPGVTHLLRREGDNHVVQVIMLDRVLRIIEAGRIELQGT